MKRHSLTSNVAIPILLAAAGLAGCGGDDPPGDTGTSGTTTKTNTEETGGSGGAGGAGGDTTTGGGGSGGGTTTQPEPVKRKTMSGDVTWQVTFDDAAKAAGASNCSYTRHYEAVEDRSAHWLCPSCEVMFQADVQLSDGLEDCFSQISSTPPNAKEWLGYAGGVWWRGAGGPMTEQGTVAIEGTTATTANVVTDLKYSPDGGFFGFDVGGQLTLGEEEGDPWNGFVPPATYECGWPKANPPEYTGDYQLKKGGTLPDGLFRDKCGEVVRLHDFKGAYLVVDMAAIDCPPCQQMASEEEQFVADMAAQGIEVHVVTLLAPSLSNVFGNTSQTQLKSWSTKYKLASPVLGDRGWGLSVFEPAIGTDNIGYPSWAIVTPDLKVLNFMTGYGGFSEIKTAIVADAQ
jgi:thiol-disulfide isomerase/thioredoxin